MQLRGVSPLAAATNGGEDLTRIELSPRDLQFRILTRPRERRGDVVTLWPRAPWRPGAILPPGDTRSGPSRSALSYAQPSGRLASEAGHPGSAGTGMSIPSALIAQSRFAASSHLTTADGIGIAVRLASHGGQPDVNRAGLTQTPPLSLPSGSRLRHEGHIVDARARSRLDAPHAVLQSGRRVRRRPATECGARRMDLAGRRARASLRPKLLRNEGVFRAPAVGWRPASA